MSIDPVIQNARARLLEIETERGELKQFLAVYDRLSGGGVEAQPQASEVKVNRSPAPPALPERKGKNAKIVAAVVDLLQEHGQPMKLSALLQSLRARGVEIPGKNPLNNLGAMLSYSQELVTTPGVGWWLKPPPTANGSPTVAMEADKQFGPTTVL